jgi:hypothetical protein
VPRGLWKVDNSVHAEIAEARRSTTGFWNSVPRGLWKVDNSVHAEIAEPRRSATGFWNGVHGARFQQPFCFFRAEPIRGWRAESLCGAEGSA